MFGFQLQAASSLSAEVEHHSSPLDEAVVERRDRSHTDSTHIHLVKPDPQVIEAVHGRVRDVAAVNLVPRVLFHAPNVNAHVRRACDVHCSRRLRTPQNYLGRSCDVRHPSRIELELEVVELERSCPQHRRQVTFGLLAQFHTRTNRFKLGRGTTDQAKRRRNNVDLALGVERHLLGSYPELLANGGIDVAGAVYIHVATEVDCGQSTTDKIHRLGSQQLKVVDRSGRVLDSDHADITIRHD